MVKQDINQDVLQNNFQIIIDILKDHEIQVGNLKSEYTNITNNITELNNSV